MLKKLFGVCFFSIVATVPLFAQVDSSLHFASSYPLLEQISLWDRYNLFKEQGALLLEDIMPQRLSVTQIGAVRASGGFKPYQQAENEMGTHFKAEGGRKMKKLWVWGQFEFSNHTQDSIRWGHRKESESSTPFYYASQRAVHYQKTDYAIQTVIGTPLYKNLSASISTDYGMGDHYSTNDPRAVLKHFKLKLAPALQYNRGHLGIEAKGIWGYGQQESQVDYRNKEYYESSQWPEYHNYLSNGYGTIRTALSFSDRVYTNNQDYRGGGLSAFYKGSLHWYGSVAYESLHEEYDRGNSSGRYDGYDMYGDYDLDEWKASLELNDKSLTWRLRLWSIAQRGEDYNFDFSGNNYKYYRDEYGIAMYMRLKQTDLYADVKSTFTGQRDGNMMINRERGRHHIYLQAEQSFSELPVRAMIGLGYSRPYKTHFSKSPRTTVDFIEQVVRHDVVLDNSDYWQTYFGARYFFSMVSFRWQAKACWEGTFGNPPVMSSGVDFSRYRSVSQASLSLFF